MPLKLLLINDTACSSSSGLSSLEMSLRSSSKCDETSPVAETVSSDAIVRQQCRDVSNRETNIHAEVYNYAHESVTPS